MLGTWLTGAATAETWQHPSQKATFHDVAGAVQPVLAAPQLTQHPYLVGGRVLLVQNQAAYHTGGLKKYKASLVAHELPKFPEVRHW